VKDLNEHTLTQKQQDLIERGTEIKAIIRDVLLSNGCHGGLEVGLVYTHLLVSLADTNTSIAERPLLPSHIHRATLDFLNSSSPECVSPQENENSAPWSALKRLSTSIELDDIDFRQVARDISGTSLVDRVAKCVAICMAEEGRYVTEREVAHQFDLPLSQVQRMKAEVAAILQSVIKKWASSSS